MNKKFIVLALIVLIASVGLVCASETEKIDNCEFTIPDGYHKTNESGSTTFFANDAGDSFSIEVKTTYYDELNIFGDPATIGGHEGVIRSYDNGEVSFFYLEDGNIVTITASDQSLIETLLS